MFFSFQNFLPKAAANYKFTQQFKAIQICQEYRKIALDLFKSNQDQTFPLAFEEATLTIGVTNSAWSQHLTMHKQTIIDEINKKYGQGTLKNVKIKHSEKPQEFKNYEEDSEETLGNDMPQ